MRNDTTDTVVRSPWLTTNQASKYLQMSHGALSAKANTGEIASYIRGNTRFFHTDDLDAFMRALPSGAKVSAVLQAC